MSRGVGWGSRREHSDGKPSSNSLELSRRIRLYAGSGSSLPENTTGLPNEGPGRPARGALEDLSCGTLAGSGRYRLFQRRSPDICGNYSLVLFSIRLETREVQIVGITDQPCEAWMKQMGRNLTDPFDSFLRDVCCTTPDISWTGIHCSPLVSGKC